MLGEPELLMSGGGGMNHQTSQIPTLAKCEKIFRSSINFFPAPYPPFVPNEKTEPAPLGRIGIITGMQGAC